MPGLCLNRSLIILNLSDNDLDDNCGIILGKIVSTQGNLKDELIWFTALRNEVPKTNLNKVGINTLILDNNPKIGETAIKDMCDFFKNDSWLRSLSLNNLNLSSEALKTLVECMDRSNSIIQIGLEGNPNITLRQLTMIGKNLSKNIRKFEEQAQNEKKVRKRMKEIKSVCDASFEDFNPANLSIMESSTKKVNDSVLPGFTSLKGKIIPSGMFNRPKSAVTRSPQYSTSIFKPKSKDHNQSQTCDQCTSMNTRLQQSESRVVNLCIENAQLKSSNHLKLNPYEAFDELNKQSREPKTSAPATPLDNKSQDANAFKQISEYIHEVERLCDGIDLDGVNRKILKESLGKINGQIVNLGKVYDSQRSVSMSKDNSKLFINLKDQKVFNKGYYQGSKQGRVVASTPKQLVQRSMY